MPVSFGDKIQIVHFCTKKIGYKKPKRRSHTKSLFNEKTLAFYLRKRGVYDKFPTSNNNATIILVIFTAIIFIMTTNSHQ